MQISVAPPGIITDNARATVSGLPCNLPPGSQPEEKRARRFSMVVLPALDKRKAHYFHTIPDVAGIYANSATVG